MSNFLSIFLLLFFFLINSNVCGQLKKLSFGRNFSQTTNFIEISYGTGNFNIKNESLNLKSFSHSEIKLGKRYIKPTRSFNIINFSDNYLYSAYQREFNNKNVESSIYLENWKFGLDYRIGYGYRFIKTAVLPYYQMGLNWNNIKFLTNSGNDLSRLKLYNNQFKFATSNAAGFDIQVSSRFTVGASYQTNIILPYYKTWKHLGSYLLELLAQTGLDYLTEGIIIKAVPSLTPIIYFIIKNGLSYYTFSQKKEAMYYPLGGTAPLTTETLIFNLNITI